MSLVPWKYCNPYANLKYDSSRDFRFSEFLVKINQNPETTISLDSNTGNVVWDGAYLLARYLEKEFLFKEQSLVGLNCLELGSGTALVGLVAWIKGANVKVTDLPDQIPLIEENIVNNCLSCPDLNNSIEAVCLDWKSPDLTEKFDLILGSEIIYLSSVHLALLKTLKRFCQPGHTQILLSYKERGLGEDRFFALAQHFGFKLTKISRELLDPEFRDTSSYQIVCLELNS